MYYWPPAPKCRPACEKPYNYFRARALLFEIPSAAAAPGIPGTQELESLVPFLQRAIPVEAARADAEVLRENGADEGRFFIL